MTILPAEIPLDTLRKIMERHVSPDEIQRDKAKAPRARGIPGASSVVPADSQAWRNGSPKY